MVNISILTWVWLRFWVPKRELQLNKANMSDTEASFLDLHLSISDGFVKTKIYVLSFRLNIFYNIKT